MFIKQYRFKSVEFRDKINLKLYETELIIAIKNAFPKVEVLIFKDHIKIIFENEGDALNGSVQNIEKILGVECDKL